MRPMTYVHAFGLMADLGIGMFLGRMDDGQKPAGGRQAQRRHGAAPSFGFTVTVPVFAK